MSKINIVLVVIIVLLFGRACDIYAAEFLVMKEVRSGYVKGDIMEAYLEDGRLQAQPPNVPFVTVRCPGLPNMTMLDMEAFKSPALQDVPYDNGKIAREALYFRDWAFGSGVVDNAISGGGEVTLTIGACNTEMEKKTP
jgi:hypothetical protein